MAKGSYHGTEISKYYQSFSGTDTLAFIMLPGCTPVLIGSLTTISYSMYRNKKPVINIGRTNINGVTRGSRIYAGTMIFTLINQHWLKELQEQPEASWLADYTELKTDEMPLFDIMIISANEYGNCVHMYLWGIDITDEAQTISVEDLFTENTFSFIARDISVFKKFNPFGNRTDTSSHIAKPGDSQRFFILDNSKITINELGQLEKEFTTKALIAKTNRNKRKYETLARDLYFSTTNTMMGNDVAKVQELLLKEYPETSITGIFDETTDKLVRNFQSKHRLDINGIVDFKTYNIMLGNIENTNNTRIAVVVNKHGAFVYQKPMTNANIVDTRPYRDYVEVESIVTGYDNNNKYYKTGVGYILEQDMYSAYHSSDIIEFPSLKYGDENNYVTAIQSILVELYSDFSNITGVYDHLTEYYVKKFQKENGLDGTGIIDYQTWLLFQSVNNDKVLEANIDNFKITVNKLPGTYHLDGNITDYANQFFAEVSCNNYINVKCSTVCLYKNSKTKVLTNTVPIKELTKITPQQNAFIYDPKIGAAPKQVDFIIYPYNKKPYKWTIML